jgi:hypothetical protein
MSAQATTLPAPREQRTTLEVYRDDGPSARALGALLGRVLPLPPLVLLVLGALPAAIAIATQGDDTSAGTTAGLVAWFVLCAAISSGRPNEGSLRWAVPPLLRASEYGGLVWIATVAGDAVPGAFALLCAIAFRHYDLVYRGRHRGVTSPAWLDQVALGWDGRLLVACALLLADLLPAGFFVLAAIFAVVFVTETVAGWAAFSRAQRVGPTEAYDDEEDEA